MKNSFFLIVFFFIKLTAGNAQRPICTPDTSIMKIINIIHPSPFQDTVPGSGIPQSACIGEPFALPFTLLVPNVINIGGQSVPLFSAQLPTRGALRGLPDGLTYECEPPNCVMLANTPGCILISGIPSVTNDTGAYNLSLSFNFSSILSFPAEIPGLLVPGEYILQLNAAGQCENTTSIKLPEGFIQTKLAPNPFSTSTTLSFWNTNQAKKATLNIHNMTGQIIRSSSVRLDSGFNQIQINRENLPTGLYLTAMSVGSIQLLERFVIND